MNKDMTGDAPLESLGGNAQKMLRDYIERIERLEEEKRSLAEDVKEIYAEAKANGLDRKAMRKVVMERRQIARMGESEFNDERNRIDIYFDAVKRKP